MAGEDLGALIPGEGPMQAGASGGGIGGASPPSGGGTWQSLVNDPISRSAMMSFGLQLMVGGYGNSLSQFGQALGAGAEGAGNTAKALQAQQINDRDFQAKQDEGNLNRASHEKVAQIGASSREEVAHVKTEGMLERSRLIHGPQNSQEMKIVTDAANKYLIAQENQAVLSKLSEPQRRELALAWGKQQLQAAREATGVRSQGSPLPAEPQGAGSSSGAPPPTSGPPAAGGQSAPNYDIGLFPPRAIFGQENVQLNRMKNDPKHGAEFQELLKTPEGRERIIKANPALEKVIRENYGK